MTDLRMKLSCGDNLQLGFFLNLVCFRMDEGKPLEPVHVHVSKGVPFPHATKILITQAGNRPQRPVYGKRAKRNRP